MTNPASLHAGPFLTQGTDWGTPLDYFDLAMALAPGMTEDTRVRQGNKALAYWNAIVAANVADSNTLYKAGFAVTWLTAELARVSNPPPNTLRVVYPV